MNKQTNGLQSIGARVSDDLLGGRREEGVAATECSAAEMLTVFWAR